MVSLILQIKQRGTLCRAEKTPDDCDLPEFCTGENEKVEIFVALVTIT
jgi:hypothetical protein